MTLRSTQEVMGALTAALNERGLDSFIRRGGTA